MEEETKFEMEENIRKTLSQFINALQKNSVIMDYQDIEKRVENHTGLRLLVENIKEEQKLAVKFAHYGQTEAEKVALHKADELTAQFDEHPLVISYREKLIEANDLLQHLTQMLEKQINQQIERKLEE